MSGRTDGDLIVFFDVDHGSGGAPDDLIGLVREVCRSAKIRIHAVYLGSINDQDDKRELGLATMQRIAAASGGLFIRP